MRRASSPPAPIQVSHARKASLNVLKVKPLDQLGSPMEIVREGFGSKKDYQQAISDLEDEIYWTPPPKQA